MEEEQLEHQHDGSREEQDAESQEDANPSNEDENDATTAQEDVSESDESNASESDDDESDDDDAMVPLAKLKKVRNEAKNLRERLKAAEAKVAELESATSDTALVQERNDLKRQVSDLSNQLTNERLKVHLDKAAETSGALEPSVVGKLVDTSKVEWGDEGKPTNLDALITDLKTAYPKLFATVHGTGNVGNRTEPRGRDDALTPSSRLAQAYQK